MPASTKHTVEITFRNPGAKPPVYVTGAFTIPPWEQMEMEYHSIQDDQPNEYIFSKRCQVAEGRWQYKFRLGTGDWWVCDESTEIVADEVGNPNNLLVVAHAHGEYTCVNKRIHAKPLSRRDDSDQDSAWEAVEIGIAEPSSIGISNETHPKHCHVEGQCNPRCSREKLPSDLEDNHNAKYDSEHTSGLVEGNHKPPLFAYSEATSENTSLPSIAVPAIKTENGDTAAEATQYIEQKDRNDRKMSNVDIETVKHLMTMSGPSSSAIADHDGEILDLDLHYSTTQLSPALVEIPSSHSPLLPHECLTCEDVGALHHHSHLEGTDPSRKHSGLSVSSTAVGPPTPPTPDNELNDSNIELFPSGAHDILRRIATLQTELPTDDAATYEPDESIFDSPPRLTKDAPTFAYELPPIGSLEDRRRLNSIDSPKFSTLTDGSSDTRPYDRTQSAREIFQLPSSHTFKRAITNKEDRRNSLAQSFVELGGLEDEEDALLAGHNRNSHGEATYVTRAQHFMASDGMRLRTAKAADLDSLTKDLSSIATNDGPEAKSFGQRLLDWLFSLWAMLFGVHGNR